MRRPSRDGTDPGGELTKRPVKSSWSGCRQIVAFGLRVYGPEVRRRHLFEFHEPSWFPTTWRDLVTDFLSFFFHTCKPYVCAAPVLERALEGAATNRMVDLCAGAGAPVLSLLPALEAADVPPVSVTLTDLFPNLPAFRAAVKAGGGGVASVETPVDATDVPRGLVGLRTIFNQHLTAAVGPWGVSFAANLTPDEDTGLGDWTEEGFIAGMQTGTHRGIGRPILPPMPWFNLAMATE